MSLQYRRGAIVAQAAHAVIFDPATGEILHSPAKLEELGASALLLNGLVAEAPPVEDAPSTSIVSVARTRDQEGAPGPSTRRPPRKRRDRKPDKRCKGWSSGITAAERQDILRADAQAKRLRASLNTTLDFHPVHMDEYPEGDLDTFFSTLRARISTWLNRQGLGSWWVWIREAYQRERSEHLHMVMCLPRELRPELASYLRGLFPGRPELVRVGERIRRFDHETLRWSDGLQYRLKQLAGNAVGPPGPKRLRRETHSRHDGSPVAPVWGRRTGVSRSLEPKAKRKVTNRRKRR